MPAPPEPVPKLVTLNVVLALVWTRFPTARVPLVTVATVSTTVRLVMMLVEQPVAMKLEPSVTV